MKGTKTPGKLRFGLRQKALLILLTTLLVTLTFNTWLAFRAQQSETLNETNRRGQEMTRFLAQYLAYSVIAFDYHTIELLLKELVGDPAVVYARVLSAKGNTMAEIGGGARERPNVVSFAEDIRLNNEKVGQLLLGLSTERIVSSLEKQRLASIWRQFMVIFAILLVELAVLSYFIMRPIGIISRAIGASVADGHRMRPIPYDSNDELGEVARQFNKLQAQLGQMQAQMQARIDRATDGLRRANQRLTTQAVELKRANQELTNLTNTDPMTGLYNRRHFATLMDSEVALSIRNNEMNSIIFVDIDNFKSYNDRYGHDVGDEIIKWVAQVISGRVRKTDVACRYGGDEFIILCRRAPPYNALTIAQDLRRTIAASPFRVGDLELNITLSIGVATIPGEQPITNTADFLRCADLALYASKQQGRDRVTHYTAIQEEQPV